MRGSRRLVIRAPNHLGDVVMALPALRAAAADVMARRWLIPLLEMASLPGALLPLDRGLAGWRRGVTELRHRGYEEGVLLTPSFSAAWLFRWGGVRRLRGTASDGRSLLLSDRIERDELRPLHRVDQYRLLLGQELRGASLDAPLRPPPEVVETWRDRLGDVGPWLGVVPGSNAPARRWPAANFASLAERMAAEGWRVVVLGGGGEAPITSRVAAAAPGSLDLGGRTDLRDLAAVLSLCRVVVTNDTGPMHLAAAVGTPVVTLWGPSSPGEVRPVGAPVAEVHGAGLPCRPCFRNECPRRGAGTLLPEAHEECMRLITVDQVHEATRALAGESGRV